MTVEDRQRLHEYVNSLPQEKIAAESLPVSEPEDQAGSHD